jgi:hypothetical protein
MDERVHIVEASIEFDQSGRLERVCRKGHVDMQDWSCSNGPFSSRPLLPQTKFDDRGRIIQQQHFQFDPKKLDTCIYDDRAHSSECRVDAMIFRFTFNEAGRALTYHVRRMPIEGESMDAKEYLDKAYSVDVKFSYKDDAYGNWTEYDAVGKDPLYGVTKVLDHQTVQIDYY